jgi:mono/diheme cytochrome c family protein
VSKRERQGGDAEFEPFEPNRPIPWTVLALTLALAAWGGLTLWRTYEVSDSGPDPQLAAATARSDAVADGAELFRRNCETCHQANGVGVAAAVPPLAGARFVAAPPEVMVQIVLHGIDGPITVRGFTYDGRMPTFKDSLDDAEIAGVVSHVRGRWARGAEAIDAAFVAAQRERFAGRDRPWDGGAELAATLADPSLRAGLEETPP